MELDFLTTEILNLLGKRIPLIKLNLILPLAEDIALRIKKLRKDVLSNLQLDIDDYLMSHKPNEDYNSSWSSIFDNSSYSDVERALNDFTRVCLRSV